MMVAIFSPTLKIAQILSIVKTDPSEPCPGLNFHMEESITVWNSAALSWPNKYSVRQTDFLIYNANQSLTRVSISKNLEKKWLHNFSLARENGIFISLSCLDFQDVKKKILFLFSVYEIFQTILFLFSIFKNFKKNSRTFLDLWDSETRFYFSSRIFKILRKKSLSLLV